jgi:hypothetical protein
VSAKESVFDLPKDKSNLKGFVLVFLSLIFVLSFLISNSVGATPYSDGPIITVVSPVDGKVYTESFVPLQFTTAKPYSKYTVTGQITQIKLDGVLISQVEAAANTNLTDLTNGEHTVEIVSKITYTSEGAAGFTSRVSISFTVNTGVGPSVQISGGPNFASANVTLTVSVKDANSHLTYSLDGGLDNAVLPAQLVKTSVATSPISSINVYKYNITYSDLAVGAHKLTVSATDKMGNTATTNFDLTVTSKQTTSTPTTSADGLQSNFVFLTIIIVSLIVATVAGLTYYFSRKQKKINK